MIDHDLTHVCLRQQAVNFVAYTTGVTTLRAVSTGYTRVTGSFLTDGLLAGMEMTPGGFPETTRCMITTVSALSVTVSGTRAPSVAAPGRSLTVGLPGVRLWENLETRENGAPTANSLPIAGRPYVTEEFLVATRAQHTFGMEEETGLYRLKLYWPENTGTRALKRVMDLLTRQYAPNTQLAIGNGDFVQVQYAPAPVPGQVLRGPSGWAYLTLSVPWRAYTFQ